REAGLLHRDHPVDAHRVSVSRAKKAPGPLEDLPLLLESLHLEAQLPQLGALVRAEALALAEVELELLVPRSQRLNRDPQLFGDQSKVTYPRSGTARRPRGGTQTVGPSSSVSLLHLWKSFPLRQTN